MSQEGNFKRLDEHIVRATRFITQTELDQVGARAIEEVVARLEERFPGPAAIQFVQKVSHGMEVFMYGEWSKEEGEEL